MGITAVLGVKVGEPIDELDQLCKNYDARASERAILEDIEEKPLKERCDKIFLVHVKQLRSFWSKMGRAAWRIWLLRFVFRL